MHLSDNFIGVIAYVTYFIKSVSDKQEGDSQIGYQAVKEEIHRQLTLSMNSVKAGQVSEEDYDQARFAVCAWIDEALLNSAWKEKDTWMQDQLQRIYFNTTDAGEKFFDRLNALGAHQLEVREVYYLCLALGFTGRYFNNEFNLDQIKTTNLKLLMGSSLGLPSLERVDLFPEAYPTGDPEIGAQKNRFMPKWAIIAFAAAPILLFVALWIIYSFILDGVGQNYLRMVAS